MNKINKIIILTIFIFLLTGCFNYQEINDYAIVSAISIDMNEKDDNKYDIGVQIMNAKKKENSNISEITFYKSSGNTIFEALQKIMLDSPKELYLGHNEVVVISDNLLKKKNPINYLDYFMRDAKMEKDSVVLISKDNKAYDVLKILTPLETVPSHNLKATLLASSKVSGITNVTTLDEFVSYLKEEGNEATLPSVIITGNIKKGENTENISDSDPNSKIKFSKLGIFKNNKLVGYLNDTESFGYNIISNSAEDTYISFKCDDKNYAALKISNSKTSEKLSFGNKIPIVKIKNKITADLTEYNCKANLINNKTISKIEKKASQKVNSSIKITLNKLYNDFKSDSLGYGEKFFKQKNKEMKLYNYSINNIKNKIKFKSSSKVKLKSTELTIKSIKKEDNYE